MEEQKAERKSGGKKGVAAVISLAVACVLLLAAVIALLLPNIQSITQYNEAVALMNSGKYSEAIAAFEAMGGYSDSQEQIEKCRGAIVDGKYSDAVAAVASGDYITAYELFDELDGYKDSQTQKEQIWPDYKQALLDHAYESGTVFFGSYEQDNDLTNGQEDIEWIVLDKKGDKLFLISKYALDSQPYNETMGDVTWEISTLRAWLNDSFYNTAFSSQEQNMILTTEVSADRNAQFGVNPGNGTQDKVFLLSTEEAEEFFWSDLERLCEATAYAEARGVGVNNANGSCSWWLRTPGWDLYVGGCVDAYGVVSCVGDYVYHLTDGARPVIWIDLGAQ